MVYKTNCIPFQQDGHIFYLFKMLAKDLLDISIVEHYESNENEGYQRPAYPGHYRKIASYLRDSLPAILPTAILAAVDPKSLKLSDENILLIDSQIRIVDGQHRILGLKSLRDGYNSTRYEELLASYEFPIILMAEDQMNGVTYSRMEVEAFININSKGRPVRTDLAESLRAGMYQKDVREKFEEVFLDTNTELNVTNNIIQNLAKTKSSFWYKKVILGDEIDRKKPISITAFSKAIRPIVQCRLQNIQTNGCISTEVLSREEAFLCEYIERVWAIVCVKWPKCFFTQTAETAEYDDSYNICKGIGIFPIYGLAYECILNNQRDFERGISEFEATVANSQVEASDWLIGGSFTGMSSGQASKKIIRFLKNEALVERF